MAKMVKMCDMNPKIAVRVFQALNPGKVMVLIAQDTGMVTRIKTTVEPKELVYPEGWYYANGRFTNKHNSTTGAYASVLMFNAQKDEVWDVTYCTAD